MFWSRRISNVSHSELDPHASPKWIASKDFHLKEYENLRKEITDHVEHYRKLEIYALAGIAAFYAWYFANKEARVDPAALWLPVLIAFLGAFRSWATLKRIFEVGDYLSKLEAQISFGGLGWETLQAAKSRHPFLSTMAIYWTALILVSLVALVRLTKPGIC